MTQEKRRKIIRGSITLVIFIGLFLAIFLFLYFHGAFSRRNSLEEIKKIITSHPGYSYLIFTLIQYLQVVILPIPAAITTTAGVIVF